MPDWHGKPTPNGAFYRLPSSARNIMARPTRVNSKLAEKSDRFQNLFDIFHTLGPYGIAAVQNQALLRSQITLSRFFGRFLAKRVAVASIYHYKTSYIVISAREPDRPTMNQNDAALGLKALGNETRLSIFRLLVRAGDSGLPIGRIAQELNIPLSTLAHHLDQLVRVSLVVQRRDGREVYCKANYGSLNALTAFLTEKCCEGLLPAPGKDEALVS